MSQVSVSRFIDQINALPLLKRKTLISKIIDSQLASKEDEDPQVIIWHNKLVRFVANQYIKKPDDVWLLDSVLGNYRVNRRLKQINYHLHSETIEMMFMNISLSFYTAIDDTYLLSQKNELTEADFGPLRLVKAIDALKRFGLESLETAKEKGYINLRVNERTDR
jgi:hypothetical protein